MNIKKIKTFIMDKNMGNVKRFSVFLLCLMFVILMFSNLTACSTKTSENIFKNFKSTPPYTNARKLFDLPEGYFFASYDSNADLFIIGRRLYDDSEGDDEYIRYGFANSFGIIIEPIYYSIVDIKNNHAVVVIKEVEGNEFVEKIGVVNIKYSEYGFATKDAFSLKYNPAIIQYAFLNEKYLVINGGKTESIDPETNSTNYSFSVVYDYVSSDVLLEVGRVTGVNKEAKFLLYDNFLSVAIPGSVRFFDFNTIENGLFKQISSYIPTISKLGYDSVEMSVYYLGEYEYLLTGIYMQDSAFDGYDIAKNDTFDNPQYMKVESTIYNVKSNKNYEAEKTVLVANSYLDETISAIVYAFAQETRAGYTKNPEEDAYIENVQILYDYPFVSPTRLIKDRNSILYILLPIAGLDKDPYSDFYNFTLMYNTSFVAYNKNSGVEPVVDAYLPILYVDGYGVQRMDPNFGLPYRDVAFYEYNNNKYKILKPLEERIGYDPYIIHDKVMIVEATNLDKVLDIKNLQKMGAFDLVNKEEIIPFEYDIITPFFDGVSIIGNVSYSTFDEEEYIDKINYWRFDIKKGITALEPLGDIFSVHNGTYVERKGGKFSLYSNSGRPIFDKSVFFDEIVVYDLMLEGDYMFSSLVYTREGNIWSVYRLN